MDSNVAGRLHNGHAPAGLLWGLNRRMWAQYGNNYYNLRYAITRQNSSQ